MKKGNGFSFNVQPKCEHQKRSKKILNSRKHLPKNVAFFIETEQQLDDRLEGETLDEYIKRKKLYYRHHR